MRTRTMMMWAAVMTLVLAACGSSVDDPDSSVASLNEESAGSGGATGTTAPDFEEAQLAFAECMRGEDIPVPDDLGAADLEINGAEVEEEPDLDALSDSDSVTIDGVEIDTGDFVAAIDACRDLMDRAVAESDNDPELTAEFQDQLIAFSQCMRDQGLDFPDPVFEENGDVFLDIGETGLDPESEEFKSAEEACGGPPRPPGEEEGSEK